MPVRRYVGLAASLESGTDSRFCAGVAAGGVLGSGAESLAVGTKSRDTGAAALDTGAASLIGIIMDIGTISPDTGTTSRVAGAAAAGGTGSVPARLPVSHAILSSSSSELES